MKNLIIVFFFIFTQASCGQNKPIAEFSDSTKNQIDALFAEFDNLNSPGYAIGISKNGQTLYKNGYGSANLDYNIPIKTNSSFSIASVSKQFTAACIALLIIENKVSLVTPAFEFIPELKKYRDTIRVKHLIYNTSGLTEYYRLPRKSGKSWNTFNYFDIKECINTSLEQDDLQFKPGDKWDYCNVNWMLLTQIVEKAAGQPFSEFAKKRLFTPLGMTSTFINDDITAIVKNRVTPYNLRTKDYIDYYNETGVVIKNNGKYIHHHRNSPHYGGSGVISTVDDLLKWSENMLSKKFGGEPFYNLMHKTIKFNHDRDNQAFGLYLGDFNGKKIIAWDGGDWGISSQLLRFPDEGVAIVVLSNLGSGEAFRKVNGIADILINDGILE